MSCGLSFKKRDLSNVHGTAAEGGPSRQPGAGGQDGVANEELPAHHGSRPDTA